MLTIGTESDYLDLEKANLVWCAGGYTQDSTYSAFKSATAVNLANLGLAA